MPISAYRQGQQVILATPDDVMLLRSALRSFIESRRERPRHEWPPRDRTGLHVATEVLGLRFSQGLTLTTGVWQACCEILGTMGIATTLGSSPGPAWRPARRVRVADLNDEAEEGIDARSRL